jgi:hypothetical protein
MTMSKNPTFGLFVTSDGITGATFFLLVGLPILYSGRWFLGSISILMGLLMALCDAMNEMKEQDKVDIRFNILEAHDVVEEIKTVNDPVVLLSALESLAKKMNKKKKGTSKSVYEPNFLELACQEAAYLALNKCSQNDPLVAPAISLLALVAKNNAVRERHMNDKDYGLSLPLLAMRSSLLRIQEQEESSASERDERQAAEVQRKSFLWLGALADQHVGLATHIVDDGGLESILYALDWFRHHFELNNWGLWAVFNLCFEHEGNQAELVRMGGLTILCKSILLNSEDSIEVSRHGLAVLFDVLRQPQHDLLSTTKVLEIRQIAIGAGLHDAVRKAMGAHPESMEIMGMGTEMLVSTGFQGDIPIYQPLE